MGVVRGLERRLERLMEGVAGKVFSGRIHPSELSGKLAREADLARFDHPTGPATANHYVIEVNPADLTVEPTELSELLRIEVSSYTVDEGLRLEGPVSVDIRPTTKTSAGSVGVHLEVLPGPFEPWAKLLSASQDHGVAYNRSAIGRSPEMDIALADASISRRHALLWRENGQTWIQDLGSSNGTFLDGDRLGSEPALLVSGSILGFGQAKFRFVES